MMDISDEATKVNCSDWSIGKSSIMSLTSSPMFHSAFEQECRALYTKNGDSALSSKDYDKAIELYSAAIDLHIMNGQICAASVSNRIAQSSRKGSQTSRYIHLCQTE
jgi:hypothetical protein